MKWDSGVLVKRRGHYLLMGTYFWTVCSRSAVTSSTLLSWDDDPSPDRMWFDNQTARKVAVATRMRVRDAPFCRGACSPVTAASREDSDGGTVRNASLGWWRNWRKAWRGIEWGAGHGGSAFGVGGLPLCSVDGRSWIEREQILAAQILCALAAPLSYVDIGTLVESWVLSFFHWCTYS